jgi:hypothetical protein
MTTIDLTEEQKELFCGLAKEESMSVGDFLLKCVKTIQLFFKEWEEVAPVEEEKKPKYEITFDGVAYQAKSCRQLYTNLVTGIGPRRLFATYSGNATVLKAALDKGDNKDLYQKLEDGKHVFYLYISISEATMWKRVEEFATSFNVAWEKK